jgi:hypothetical protein
MHCLATISQLNTPLPTKLPVLNVYRVSPVLAFAKAHGAIDIGNIIITMEQMRKREFLGQHEPTVMPAILRVGRQAYGVPIAAEIAERTGREMLQGSVGRI